MPNPPNKERKCERCMAHYTGNHTCPPFMKMLKDLGSGENAYKIIETPSPDNKGWKESLMNMLCDDLEGEWNDEDLATAIEGTYGRNMIKHISRLLSEAVQEKIAEIEHGYVSFVKENFHAPDPAQFKKIINQLKNEK